MRRYFLLILFSMALLSCGLDSENYAPVVEISTIDPIPKQGTYVVRADDTLYSIAWRYGLDYQDIANWNNIQAPFAIQVGQTLQLKRHLPKNKSLTYIPPTTVLKPPPLTSLPPSPEPKQTVSKWFWPVHGPLLRGFSFQNKGINIGGQAGDFILATAPGKVVYSGNGLRGYGNLLIIKHNSTFLSAYAHNATLFVKDGDWVQRGQKIAAMGSTGTNRTMLHFEIRRNGKPVNPLIYLEQKN
jgi:lipoprotein NlpD